MSHHDMLVTLHEAADILGCTDSVLRNWIKQGRLTPIEATGKARVRLASLRGLPKKMTFSDDDIEYVASRRLGVQQYAAA